MKHTDFPLVLLVIVLILALMACIYVSNSIPAFNGVVDTLADDILSVFNHVEDSIPENRKEIVSIAEKNPVLPQKSSQKDLFEFTEKGYTLASIGKNKWLYESSWPFVTTPVIHDDVVVTATAEPAFLIFSYETGELLVKQECPVYPGEQASFEGNILTLMGRDRQLYFFRLEDSFALTDIRSEQSQDDTQKSDKNADSLLGAFVPHKAAEDFMTARIKEWSASDEVKPLPELQLYIGHINQEGNGNFWAEENNGGDTCLYVFTPDKQGIYQIGLADENGAWIKADAFVAVFGENGDLKQVSIDYVANRPQIKLHLSDTEIYYIVTGWALEKYDGTRTWLQIAESR